MSDKSCPWGRCQAEKDALRARVERMEKVVEAAKQLMDWNLLFLDQPRIPVHTKKLSALWCVLATVEQGGTEARPCHICGVGHVFGIACPEPKGGTGKEEGNG